MVRGYKYIVECFKDSNYFKAFKNIKRLLFNKINFNKLFLYSLKGLRSFKGFKEVMINYKLLFFAISSIIRGVIIKEVVFLLSNIF